MAGFLGEDEVRRVKEAVDLVQLIGEYTSLQRSGTNFKACCPFHDERTPSFYIYTDDAHYHCYGCGQHGDAIRFVMEKENLAFMEAMEFLARRAGLELKFQKGNAEEHRAKRGERERLLQILERTTALYERYLWDQPEGAEARAYLQERGLGEEVCREFRLGWSPGREKLVRAATRQGFEPRDLMRLDLAVDRNGRLADRFYERLMFPVCDRFGQPIAFSGRLLPAAERAAKEAGRGVGKYINNTDTPLYNKSRVVFNLHRARTGCRQAKRLIVMEGPTDVMAASQAGAVECVAVLGTALTAEHARQMGNVVGEQGRLVLLFDGDSAGQANSLKAVRTCLGVGLPNRVAVMPAGKDPAELLGQQTGEPADDEGDPLAAFEAVLAAQKPDIVHLCQTLAPRPHGLEIREQWDVADKLLSAIRPMGDADMREGYLQEVANHLNLDPVRLRKRMSDMGSDAPLVDPEAEVFMDEEDEDFIQPLGPVHETILHVLVQVPESRGLAFDDLGVEPAAFPIPWNRIVEKLAMEPETSLDGLVHDLDLARFQPVTAALYRWKREPRTRDNRLVTDADVILRDCAKQLRIRDLERERGRVEYEMRRAEQDKRFQDAGALYQEFMQVSRQLTDLGQ